MKYALCAIILATATAPSLGHAQPAPTATDALTDCVVRSMSMDDSVTTTRWLFIAMSRHPSLVSTAQVSDADGLEANRRMGALLNRLLFDACATEARAAFQSAGQQAALEATFGTLGEKAMTDLMGNRDVLASVIQLGAYVDQNRLEALTQ